jgi:L-threonylcarbamoyladenylate synthase
VSIRLLVEANEENIQKAAEIVKRGGIVIYPTDTVYGLGGDPFNLHAVYKIITIKKRENNPLPILASDIECVKKIAYINEFSKKMMEEFWPGPLTLILRKKEILPDLVTSGLGNVGVRIPNNQIALKLIKLSGGLLIGTSANLSKRKISLTGNEAYKQIGKYVDIVLNGGLTTLKKESTVVRLNHNRVSILRKGAVKEEKLHKVASLV